MKRVWLLTVVAFATACGGDSGSGTAVFSVSWQAPELACAQRQSLANRLEVWLQVGPYDACQLTVDKTDLTASSECGPVIRGTVWPVVVTYREHAPDASAGSVPIAYFVSYLNLCGDKVSDTTSVVDLSLENDGVTGRFVYLPSDLSAVVGSRAMPSCSNGLQESLEWAVANVIGTGAGVLDVNCNCGSGTSSISGCSNLEEACQDTLFTIPSTCGGT